MQYEANAKAGGTAPLVGNSPGAFVFSGLGPRIMLAPEGGAGSAGGAGEGGAAGGEGAGDAGAGAGGSGGEGGAVEPPSRPDYIPESFWDAEKGFKTDDFNTLLTTKAERDAHLAQVPEKPDGYQVKLPESFQLPEGFSMPEGQQFEIDENDPRVGAVREFAHANQLSQDQFGQLIAIGAQMDIAEQMNLNTALEKQREELGAKGVERVNAVTTWLGAKLGGEAAQALAPMLYTAKQVQAFERLMSLFRGVVPGGPGAGRDGLEGSTKVEGYDKMNFQQRMAAIDRLKSGN